MKTTTFFKIWHTFLKFAFFYAIYHLARDILQDIFGIRNTFTEFAHFEADPARVPILLQWATLGFFGRYSTFPIEIFFIFAIPRALKNKRFKRLDLIMVLVLLLTSAGYLINIVYAK